MHPKQWGLILLGLLVSILVGCVSASYQPPMLPVKLTINSAGEVSIEGEASLVTPVGIFSLGASLPIVDSSQVLVILRDKNKNTDQIYIVRTGEQARIVVNGTTEIQIGNDRKVIIDVTAARVQTVEINGKTQTSQIASSLQSASSQSSSASTRPQSSSLQPASSQSSTASTRPQSSIASLPSQPITVFEDDFDGTTLDSSKWSLDNFVNNYVLVNGNALHLSSSSNRSPYIYTRSTPFPSTGSFRFTVRYRYSKVDTCGAAISLTSAFLPPFIQGQGPSGANEGSDKLSFFIWHEVIWYETQSGRQNILLPGAYSSSHEVVIEYQGNRYRVSQDGSALFTSDTIFVRPRYIAFGNAAIQTNSCPWDSLDIDWVKVEQMP